MGKVEMIVEDDKHICKVQISGDISKVDLTTAARPDTVYFISVKTPGKLDLRPLHESREIFLTLPSGTNEVILPESSSLEKIRIKGAAYDGSEETRELSLMGGPVTSLKIARLYLEDQLFLNESALSVFSGCSNLSLLALTDSAVTPYETLTMPRLEPMKEIPMISLQRMRLKQLDLEPLSKSAPIEFQLEKNLETIETLDLSVLQWNTRTTFDMQGTHVEHLDISPLVAGLSGNTQRYDSYSLGDSQIQMVFPRKPDDTHYFLPTSSTSIDITPLVSNLMLNIIGNSDHWFKCDREVFRKAFEFYLLEISWRHNQPDNTDLSFEALKKSTSGDTVLWNIDEEVEWHWNWDEHGGPLIRVKPRIDLY